MILHILQDGFFAAVAAVGFAAISDPPRRAYLWCALIAAAGHATRFALMNAGVHIVAASFAASLCVGVLAVAVSSVARMPAETFYFPSLLPMIPGMYAYRAFGGLAMCLISEGRSSFDKYYYLFSYNALMCGCIILCMVVGATVPAFAFKKIAFQATR